MTSVPDDFVVIDPDDPELEVQRRRAALRVVESGEPPQEAERSAAAGEAEPEPVRDRAIPKAGTQPHTRDIGPGPVSVVLPPSKAPHDARESATLGLSPACGGVDPGSGPMSEGGVIHPAGDTAEQPLRSAGLERTGSGFVPAEVTGSMRSSAVSRIEKAADHASHAGKATGTSTPEIQPGISADDTLLPRALLADLWAFAVQRLTCGDAAAALTVLAANHPALVTAYRLGYLPMDWQRAVPTAIRSRCRGYRLAGTIILPAFDSAGEVVDLLAVHPRSSGGAYVGMHDPPRGLIAPAVLTAHQNVVVTDSLRLVVRRFAAGHTDAVLLRGPSDAAANAARFAAAGVTRVLVRTRTNAEPIAAALRCAGLAVAVVSAHPQSDSVGYDAVPLPATVRPATSSTPPAGLAGGEFTLLPPEDFDDGAPALTGAGAIPVTEPAPPPAGPVLVSHDRQAERATFTVGAVTYVVEVPPDATTTRLDIVIRHVGQVHREVVDLAVPAACGRYAGNAALRCGVAASVIAAHLPALLTAVQKMAAADSAGAATTPDDMIVADGPDRSAALALLRAPDLLDQMTADFTTLSWVGEADAKRVLLLTAISRKLPEPLWSIRTASSDLIGSHGLDIIAALTPAEDLIHVSRLSPAALAYQGQDALRHKLLVIDDATTLTPEVALALRVLKQRGALSQAVVPRHNFSGSSRTQTIEVRGPIAVLSATAGKLDRQFLAACCQVAVDESTEQTERVLAAERLRYAAPSGGGDAATRSAIIQRHHALNRLISSRPVVIPFADRIQFPVTTLRQRHEQARFLALVAASALLHQFQRLTDRGHVVADLRDFDLAVSLTQTAGICVEHDHGLGRPATVLLTTLQRAGISTFTHETIRAVLPHWGRTSFRSAVADLVDHGYVTAEAGGKGTARQYALVTTSVEQPRRAAVITLRRETTDAELVSWSVVGQLASSQLISQPPRGIDAVG